MVLFPRKGMLGLGRPQSLSKAGLVFLLVWQVNFQKFLM